ncbi:MAG: hypothetical protein IJ048_07020 [Clostridia bacterium]|nr:hypothetical protein [Clostridia bacterium]
MGFGVFAAWADDGAPDGCRIDPLDADSLFDAAGKVNEPVDLLVISLRGVFDDPRATILDRIDLDALKKAYDYNTLGVIRAINAFMPLLEEGQGRRVAVITNRESSNGATRGAAGFGDHVAHAPLNMAMNQLFNALRSEGYTFRMYVRGAEDGYDPFAAEYITRGRSNEAESDKHSDENRLVMRDAMNIEIPW